MEQELYGVINFEIQALELPSSRLAKVYPHPHFKRIPLMLINS